MTEEEKKEFYRILNDDKAFDEMLQKALDGWRRGRAWKRIRR